MLSIEGVVLHRRPYRETSFLVDIFSRQSGKVSAVAKGVRSAKSERKSLLQPFQLLSIQLHGRHELKNMGVVDALQPALHLSGHNLYCAMYLNELLNRLLPKEEPCTVLFDHYIKTLDALSVSDIQRSQMEALLREFEFALLAELGYLPDLSLESTSGKPLEHSAYYRLSTDEGLVATNSQQRSWPGETLQLVVKGEWTSASLSCAKQLSRQLLAPLLGNKPLKSRELFAPYRSTSRIE